MVPILVHAANKNEDMKSNQSNASPMAERQQLTKETEGVVSCHGDGLPKLDQLRETLHALGTLLEMGLKNAETDGPRQRVYKQRRTGC